MARATASPVQAWHLRHRGDLTRYSRNRAVDGPHGLEVQGWQGSSWQIPHHRRLLIYFGVGFVILGMLDWFRSEAAVPAEAADAAAVAVPIGATP